MYMKNLLIHIWSFDVIFYLKLKFFGGEQVSTYSVE